MESRKKQRSENWNLEEKKLLRQLISDSIHILENKSTKSQINMRKVKEWKNVMFKFNKITGKNRSFSQIKLAWKRMKLAAKANMLGHKQQYSRTGGRQNTASSSQDEFRIRAISSQDFIADHNYYDSDAVLHKITHVKDEFAIPGNSESDPLIVMETINESPTTKQEIPEQIRDNQIIYENRIHGNMNKSVVDSDINFKKSQLEMLQVEHEYNVRIAQLKIKKLQLEIDLLEKSNIGV